MKDRTVRRWIAPALALVGAACASRPTQPMFKGTTAPLASSAVASSSATVGPDAGVGEPPPSKRAIALTSSGAVSLGAYQAGYLYYLTEVLKQHRDEVDLRFATGASAGTINSFLSLLSTFDKDAYGPSESLFFEAWVKWASYQDLVAEKNGKQAAFSGNVIYEIAKRVGKRFEALKSNTDVPRFLGVTATRVNRTTTALKGKDGKLDFPRTEEKFVFSIGGAPPAPLAIRNRPVPLGGQPSAWLQLPPTGSGYEAFSRLLLASSAFPVAFPPQPLILCRNPDCQDEVPEKVDFLDGGIFDNMPLRLALRMHESIGDRRAPNVVLGRALAANGSETDAGAHPRGATPVLLVTYESPLYPSPTTAPSDDDDPKFLSHFGTVASSFAQSAMSKELLTVTEEYDDLLPAVFISRRSLPTASGHVFNLLGFLDTNFRAFDFYLGAADAAAFVAHPDNGLAAMLKLDPKTVASWAPAILDKRFAFVRSITSGDVPPKCAGSDEGCPSKEFQALARASIARVVSACEAENVYDVSKNARQYEPCSRLCKAIENGRCSSVLAASGAKDTEAFAPLRRTADETDLDHMLRLLEAGNFHYEDPELRSDAVIGIRHRLGEMVERIVSQQPLVDKAGLAVAGHIGLNASMYNATPSWRLPVTLGNDVGLSAILNVSRIFSHHVQFNVEAGIFGIFSLRDQGGLALPVRVGITPEVRWSVFQIQLPVLFGVNLVNSYSGDGWRLPNDAGHTRYHLQVGGRFVFGDRLWLGAARTLFPDVSDFSAFLTKRGEWSLTAGWMWLWPI